MVPGPAEIWFKFLRPKCLAHGLINVKDRRCHGMPQTRPCHSHTLPIRAKVKLFQIFLLLSSSHLPPTTSLPPPLTPPPRLQLLLRLPRRPPKLPLQPIQHIQQAPPLTPILKSFPAHRDCHVRLHPRRLVRRTTECDPTQPHHDLSDLVAHPFLVCYRAGAETRDGRVVDCEEDAGEVEVLQCDNVRFGHVPDLREERVLRIGGFEVDWAEGEGFVFFPVFLILHVRAPAVDAVLVRGAVGEIAERERVGRGVGSGVGVAEAELEDFDAVVEVFVGPDEVRSVFVEEFEKGPGRAQR